MCLITFAHRVHPDYPLLVAANRDEFYDRPAEGIHIWKEHPDLLAGRDLQAGGTWMGVTRGGRFAAITNHRNPPTTPARPRSRGMLTLDFLTGDADPGHYLRALDGGSYAGFNLVLGDGRSLFYYSNIEGEVRELPAGVYGLSNGLLNSAWPKQASAANRLEALLPGPVDHASLADTVSSREPAADDQLPDTGVDLALERALSSQFIAMPDYGTRATTTLISDLDGRIEVRERSFGAAAVPGEERLLSLHPDGRE